MFNKLLLLSFLFWGVSLSAQDTLTSTVYFGVESDTLDKVARVVLDAFLDQHQSTHTFQQFHLSGHTDAVRSNAYNQKLSERRAETVRTYLMATGIPANQIVVKAYGEEQPVASNTEANRRALNRRVDVVLIGLPKPLEQPVPISGLWPDQHAPAPLTIIGAPSSDTTLFLDNGLSVTLQKKDVNAFQKTYTIETALTPQAAREATLNTLAADGDLLVSRGMIRFSCEKPLPLEKVCIDLPPTLPQCQHCTSPDSFKLWIGNQDMTWQLLADDLFPNPDFPNKIYGVDYICFTPRVCEIYNIDVTIKKRYEACGYPLEEKNIPMVTVKVPPRWTLLDARLSAEEPFFISCDLNLAQRKSRTAKIPMDVGGELCACFGDVLLYAKAISPEGDTLEVPYQSAAPFHRGTAQGQCKRAVVKRWAGLFPIREKALYRRYYLTAQDFRNPTGSIDDGISSTR